MTLLTTPNTVTLIISAASAGARFQAEAGAMLFVDQAASSLLVAQKGRVLIYSLGDPSKPAQA